MARRAHAEHILLSTNNRRQYVTTTRGVCTLIFDLFSKNSERCLSSLFLTFFQKILRAGDGGRGLRAAVGSARCGYGLGAKVSFLRFDAGLGTAGCGGRDGGKWQDCSESDMMWISFHKVGRKDIDNLFSEVAVGSGFKGIAGRRRFLVFSRQNCLIAACLYKESHNLR